MSRESVGAALPRAGTPPQAWVTLRVSQLPGTPGVPSGPAWRVPSGCLWVSAEHGCPGPELTTHNS
jgi:hypothetical protein